MSVDKITIFKIKPTVASFADFIRLPDAKAIPVTPPADAAFEVEVVAAFKDHAGQEKTHLNIPWLVFLNDGLPPGDKFSFRSANRFPSAIVGIKLTEEHVSNFYAIVFGLAGDSHIDPDQIVRDFGIRVAMNICDEEKLKRIQSTRHAEVSTQSERQISTGSRFSVFDIDDEKEFLQSIAGVAQPGFDFIQSFTGKESIAIKSPKGQAINWGNLIERVRTLASAYELKNFETSFPGYAKFHIVTDTDLLDKLDELLFAAIRRHDFSSAHLAPPEVVDYSTCEFSYGQNESRFEDLTLKDLIESRRAFNDDATMNSIRQMRVNLWNVETNTILRPWNAYRCLVAETSHEGETFILSNGQWKKISNDLQEEIDSQLATIPVADCPYLPNDVDIWNPETQKNQESVFNALAARDNANLLLLDKSKIDIGGKRLYEVCDLLHSDRHLIQVKRFQSSSSSVSHLFLQGRFYSQAFMTDEQCRTALRSAITEKLGDAADPFLQIIPVERGDLSPRDYTVVYCLLSERDINLQELPFMARYDLVHSHRFLKNVLGMNCSIALRRITTQQRPEPKQKRQPK